MCRKDPNDVLNCKFKSIRNIKTNPIQHTREPNNENDDSLNDMTVVDLKDTCRVYGLSTGGLKKDLVDRVSVFMESLAMHDDVDVDGSLDENEA